ncbi:MAG: hypothetical protein LUF29_04600 [Oscillospiraceae bacterium]|nr:hypothetical protein [Oscillospiraceae bacterium]
MAKRLLCVVLSLLMIMAVLPTGVIAEADVGEANSVDEGISLTADETTYVATITDTGVSYETLSSAISAAESGQTVKLLTDVTGTITIASDDDIILDLAGCTLTVSTAGKVITVNGKLTLEDSSSDGSGKITNGSTYGAVYVYSAATFIMNGGTITDSSSGYGVYVGGTSTFTMNGGIISGCRVGVYVRGTSDTNRATFIMYGGSITDNKNSTSTSGSASGVYLTNANFTMNAGSISNNTISKTSGGGVSVTTNATFTMNGGTISNNIAQNGAGVFLSASGSVFNMNGGSITGNEASKTSSSRYGGGVYLKLGEFTMTGGAIYGNAASDAGADIYVVNGKTATLIVADSMVAEGKSFTGYKWYTDASGSRYSESNANVYSVTSGTAIDTSSVVALIAAKPTEEVIPTLYSRSLSLGTKISINYNFDFTGVDDQSSYTVKYSVGDSTTTYDAECWGTKESGDTTYYVATCNVYFYQMAQNITLYLCDSNGNTVAQYSGGSIRSYYDAVAKNSGSYSATLINLLKAMLNYGGYGQAYVEAASLVADTGALANSSIEDSYISGTDYIDSKYAPDVDSSSTASLSGLLVISSTESCKIKFTIKSFPTDVSVSDIAVTIDGVDATITTADDGTSYVVSDEILVQNWDEPVTIKITAKDDSSTVYYSADYSVLSYAYLVLHGDNSSTYSDELKNLVWAMYNYNAAADAYNG